MTTIELPHLCLLFSIGFLLYECPFTKVEESFNMQASHDLLNMLPLQNFDHLEFPGVVPRTFLGSLTLAAATLPGHWLVRAMGASSFIGQYLVRGFLGLLVWFSYFEFAKGVQNKFKSSKSIGNLCVYLTAMQFHLPFYMSRTLPNTFALFGCLIAYTQWLKGKPVRCLCILAFFMITFRCDLLVLLAPMVCQMLLSGEILFLKTFLIGFVAAIATLVLTVGVDSFLWGRWLWPEGVVLFFNTVQNKSSEWGVYPWHWYFTSAIPRSLNVSLLLVIVGLMGLKISSGGANCSGTKGGEGEKREARDNSLIQYLREHIEFDQDTIILWYYVAPALVFVCLYSFLPHKELRFVFPALPLLNMAAAKGLDSLLETLEEDEKGIEEDKMGSDENKKGRTSCETLRIVLRRLMSIGLKILFGSGVTLYFLFLLPSTHNYPGGVALQKLLYGHLSINNVSRQCKAGECPVAQPIRVHIDADAAMTGITRFGQIQPAIKNSFVIEYSKDENLEKTRATYRRFDWLLTSSPTEAFKSDFQIAEEVPSFDKFEVTVREAIRNAHGMLTGAVCPIKLHLLSPLRIKLKSSMFIMKRK